MDIKLPYGLKNGEIVSIDDVEQGLKCGCVCPTCMERLVAKKGSIKEHHFAHHLADCNRGLETVIHMVSKEIISKSKYFVTPPVYFPKTKIVLIDKYSLEIDEVTLEKQVGSIVPDIVLKTKNRVLLIEITVTHGVDCEKTQKIQQQNLAAIEIYSGDIFNKLLSNKNNLVENVEFNNRLINGVINKYWISNPRADKIIKKIYNTIEEKYCVEKKIKFVDFFTYYINYVDNCPLNKRAWKSGFKKGKSYADTDADCRECAYNTKNDLPDKIFCFGNQKDNLKEIIKDIIAT